MAQFSHPENIKTVNVKEARVGDEDEIKSREQGSKQRRWDIGHGMAWMGCE